MKFANERLGAFFLCFLFRNGGDLAFLEEAVSRVGHLVALQSPRRRSGRRDEEEEGHQAEQTCQDLNASGDDDGLHFWFHRCAHGDFVTIQCNPTQRRKQQNSRDGFSKCVIRALSLLLLLLLLLMMM